MEKECTCERKLTKVKTEYPTIKWESDNIKALRSKCQKPAAVEEPFARYFLRRISIYVTLFFNKIGLPPNFVSLLSLIFFFLTGLVLIPATPLALLLGLICYILGYLFDCVDGEMARLRNKTSKKGEFLDNIIRGNTVIITIGIVLSIIYLLGLMEFMPLVLIYIGTTIAFLGLQIPLAFEITFSTSVNDDPVYQLRKQSTFDQIAFWTGMPGFFTLMVVIIPIELLFETINVYYYFSIIFLLFYTMKVALRGFMTYMKIKQ
nr:CDP-alcohol phosphatidyltransferase family protein [Shouchella xiaoxiensis]